MIAKIHSLIFVFFRLFDFPFSLSCYVCFVSVLCLCVRMCFVCCALCSRSTKYSITFVNRPFAIRQFKYESLVNGRCSAECTVAIAASDDTVTQRHDAGSRKLSDAAIAAHASRCLQRCWQRNWSGSSTHAKCTWPTTSNATVWQSIAATTIPTRKLFGTAAISRYNFHFIHFKILCVSRLLIHCFCVISRWNAAACKSSKPISWASDAESSAATTASTISRLVSAASVESGRFWDVATARLLKTNHKWSSSNARRLAAAIESSETAFTT